MAQKRTKVLATISGVLAGLVVLRVIVGWLIFGVPPDVQVAELIYRDVPRLEIPAQLVPARPITFPARILEKRNYSLNLRVYFEGNEQRAAAEDVLGHWGRGSGVARGEPTAFRVLVRDRDGRVVQDRSVDAIGPSDIRSDSFGRRIDAFVLDKGLYEISVTPSGDVSAFAVFRMSVELTSDWKSTVLP